jgi:hypothetical protein
LNKPINDLAIEIAALCLYEFLLLSIKFSVAELFITSYQVLLLLERMQWVHVPADLWDIIFCTNGVYAKT